MAEKGYNEAVFLTASSQIVRIFPCSIIGDIHFVHMINVVSTILNCKVTLSLCDLVFVGVIKMALTFSSA